MDDKAQHVITTTTKDGKATFHKHSTYPQHIPNPSGSSTHIYVSRDILPDVSYGVTADLDATAEHTVTGLMGFKGRILPDNGFSAAIMNLKSGAVSPNHRTRTVDMGIVLEGELTLELDDGEIRTLKKGDTWVQRGTIHQWSNRGDKDVSFYAVAIDAKPILGSDGKELGEVGLEYMKQ